MEAPDEIGAYLSALAPLLESPRNAPTVAIGAPPSVMLRDTDPNAHANANAPNDAAIATLLALEALPNTRVVVVENASGEAGTLAVAIRGTGGRTGLLSISPMPTADKRMA